MAPKGRRRGRDLYGLVSHLFKMKNPRSFFHGGAFFENHLDR